MKNLLWGGKSLLFVTLPIVLLPSCKNAYQVANFDYVTQDHQTVAVLPFEMVFMGKIPKELTEEDILAIEEAESQAFQASFHNEILRSANQLRRNFRVGFQPYAKTTALLKENNISVRDSWTMDPKDLAEVLGVDAIVKARVEKTQFMSDVASYGIDAGISILSQVANGGFGLPIPTNLSNNKEIFAAYTLMDRAGNEVLWSVACEVNTDWRNKSNDVIDRLNRLSARRFPYRQ